MTGLEDPTGPHIDQASSLRQLVSAAPPPMRVIGICSGVGDGKGYYIHPEQIHQFLREKYSWLWENPQQP